MENFYYFFIALLFSVLATLIVRRLAWRLNIVDRPDGDRKIHAKPIPLMGGLAIFVSYFLVLLLVGRHLTEGNLQLSHWLGFFIGAIFLLIGGLLDDKYNLSPWQQIIWPVLAALAVILGGVSIEKITNPAGGFIQLAPLVSALIITAWLLGMMYTTKLLDGVDGLVSGVATIGALVIFLFTSATRYYQPDIALASLILAGVTLGFWFFNFNPAKIFLGESGSLLLGYILGVLSIISGGKIAIALLVMGLPILDVAWTIIRRLAKGKNPFRFADRQHLHHRLLDLGLSQKQTVLVFYVTASLFGLSGLFLQSRGKLLALVFLLAIMLVLVIIFSYLDRRFASRPRLLLHVCCAPCSAYVATQILAKKYQLTFYFYNSNIDTLEEYNRRLEAVEIISRRYNIPLVIEPYNHESWLTLVSGMECDPERGARCTICYRCRLEGLAKMAQKDKFDYFGTSLTTSPYKDSERIMNVGRELGMRYGVKFLDYDFKQDDGFGKSTKFSKELGLYRQKYCGCEFAKKK